MPKMVEGGAAQDDGPDGLETATLLSPGEVTWPPKASALAMEKAWNLTSRWPQTWGRPAGAAFHAIGVAVLMW